MIDIDLYVLLSYYFGIDVEVLSYLVYDIFIKFNDIMVDNVMDCLCLIKLDNLYVFFVIMVFVILDRMMGSE